RDLGGVRVVQAAAGLRQAPVEVQAVDRDAARDVVRAHVEEAAGRLRVEEEVGALALDAAREAVGQAAVGVQREGLEEPLVCDVERLAVGVEREVLRVEVRDRPGAAEGAERRPRIIAALDRGGVMPALVTSRREGPLLYVALNRPEKRNAIHRELLLALVDAIAAAEREPDARAVVVYGEGPLFSAGVDFGMLTGDIAGERALPFRTLIGDMQAALSRLEALEKPVVGALHRYVPGLALELALAFDLRVATADAELGLPEVRVGLVPDVGGTTRLVRTVGYAKAKELVMTGRMIGAAEALAIGLVNQVVPPGEHVAAAARLAEGIAANAPLAVGLAKRLIDLGSNVDKHTFLALELLAQSVLLRSEDAR